MNIGIFGGTFDPVHLAHIELAKLFTEKFKLGKCIFVPCNISPFKQSEHLHPASNEDRLAMLRIAIRDVPVFEISEFEIQQGGISYTINTVEHFRGLYPDNKLFLLIGRDQAAEFVRWKRFEDIARLTTIVIANRYEGACALTLPETIDRLGEFDIFPRLLNNDELLHSSTAIRFRLHKKLNTGNTLDPFVLDYIIKKNIYD